MESLATFQKLAKVGRVLCKIIFICSIVGAIGCTIGAIVFGIVGDSSIRINGLTLHGLIEKEAGVSMATTLAAIIVAGISCMFEIYLAKVGERYFTNELEAGTPFTMEGAQELKKFGIKAIVVPVIAGFVNSAAMAIVMFIFDEKNNWDYDGGVSIGIGIMLLVMSVLCKAGAEKFEDNHVI